MAKRQWACTGAECQVKRRGETQRRYRDEHPEDRASRRLRAELAAAKAGERPVSPSVPTGIGRFPWDELRDEISPEVFVVTSIFVRLLLVGLRDEMRAQLHEITGETCISLRRAREDLTARVARAG